jgi:hypothetical protein
MDSMQGADMFLYRLQKIWNPAIYQGGGKKNNYFEGWYFKQVDVTRQHRYAFIPGVSLGRDGRKPHAFIQVLEGASHKSWYLHYPMEDFRFETSHFEVSIGPNRFCTDGIELDLQHEGETIRGKLRYVDPQSWPVKLTSPGVMGWFGLLPTMECYHGVVSLDHAIEGSLDVSGKNISFDGGRGYIEKDWGSSFPAAWIWMQSNHFDSLGTSLMVSVAKIPWRKHFFTGFIVGLLHKQTLYRFATYTNARIRKIEVDEREVHLSVENRSHRIDIRGLRTEGGELISPVLGDMAGRITESLDSSIHIQLSSLENGQILINETGHCAGLEVAGNIEELIAGGIMR